MEHSGGSKVSIFCGVTGGMIKYINDIDLRQMLYIDTAWWQHTGEAILTALLCGIAGALGNHIYKLIVKPKK